MATIHFYELADDILRNVFAGAADKPTYVLQQSVYCALLTSSATPASMGSGTITNEIAAGSGYSTGGAKASAITWLGSSPAIAGCRLYCPPFWWVGLTATFRYAYVYAAVSTPPENINDGVSGWSNPAFLYVDFGSDITVTSADFQIVMPPTGIMGLS